MTRSWRWLIRYPRSESRGLALVTLLMLLGVGLDALAPWPMKLIVDHVLTGRSFPDAFLWLHQPEVDTRATLLVWLVAAGVFVIVTRQVVGLAHNYVQTGVGTRMVYRLGATLFDQLQRLSLRFHSSQPLGDLARRVTEDTSCVRELVLGGVLPILTSCVSLLMMFAILWQLDPSLSLIALVFAPALAVLIRVLARPMTERSYRQQQLEGELTAFAERTLSALPVVQAFGREAHADERFRVLSQLTLRAYLRAILSQLQFKIGASGVTAMGTAVVMAVGGLKVAQGSLSVGSLLVFFSYIASLYAPLETLAYASSGFAAAAGRARRVREVLETGEGVRDERGATPLVVARPARGATVCLEEVTFGYETGRPVLKEISIEAQAGETVALVGPTGAGKSTLVSLIPRFFDPWQGRVVVAGRDVRRVQLASLRVQIAVVLQEAFLLPLSIAENIAYGRPDASPAEVRAAAAAANADEFIRRLPDGYDTIIGERGATLSGGEKQRLAIARALLKDAPILIMDEPTAALDAHTEASVLEAIERLQEGRTTFVIAHRLSTIRHAHRIAVVENGRISTSGSPAELLASSRYYRCLNELQDGAQCARNGG